VAAELGILLVAGEICTAIEKNSTRFKGEISRRGIDAQDLLFYFVIISFLFFEQAATATAGQKIVVRPRHRLYSQSDLSTDFGQIIWRQ
jgi:hypothetical protein